MEIMILNNTESSIYNLEFESQRGVLDGIDYANTGEELVCSFINKNIRAKEGRVIDPDGNQIGIIPTYKALATAGDFGLDLVEVAPTARPPVCRVF